jgi:vacuolar protein sorting-associated protein 33A
LDGTENKASIVFFLGGCTSTEIAALRFIALKEGKRILVATTGILNGNGMMKAAMDETILKKMGEANS